MNPSPWLRWLTVAALAVSLMGCKSLLKKRVPVSAPSDSAPVAVAPPPPAPPVPVVAAPAAVDSAANAAAEDDSVPAAEDFEDEAFEKVTQANFKAEFARLQKEVASK
jgi:hypothetical protein